MKHDVQVTKYVVGVWL